MANRTLRFHILTMVNGLLFGVSIAVLIAVWISTQNHTNEQIQSELEVGKRVLHQLMMTREKQLTDYVEVLTADFGFKQAVATGDEPTITSALHNHSSRIKADLMAVISLNGTVKASTDSQLKTQTPFPVARLIEHTLKEGRYTSVVVLGNSIYQIILLPVRAPTPIAIAATGFKLNANLARRLKQITRLDITFASQNKGHEPIIISTLPEAEVARSMNATLSGPLFRTPFSDTRHYKTIKTGLLASDQQKVQVYLSTTLEHAAQEFDKLQLQILLITFAAVLLAVFFSIIFSNNLTTPLLALTYSARKIAQGRYEQAPEICKGSQEIVELLSAFQSMLKDLKDREEHIVFQATHDTLTGSLNRQQLLEKLDCMIRERSGCHLGLVSLNIRNFRIINDSFGYETGDECLRSIHQRLEQYPDTLISARVGADEFLVVINLKGTAETSLNRLQQLIEAPYKIGDLDITINFYYGISDYPRDDHLAVGLMHKAGLALDNARREKVSMAAYTTGMEEERYRHIRLMSDLKQALEHGKDELQMYYQPKLHLPSNQVKRFEALIRWFHPNEGFVSPELFIPLAEQAGIINRLTEWVVQTVIKQLALWQEHQLTGIQVAINLSAKDLSSHELLELIQKQLARHNLKPECLSFEITESDIMEDPDTAIELLKTFRSSGFSLAIDDFGTGYSSLSQLRSMPVTDLKIDKSFVMELDSQTEDQIIVRSTLDLAHRFGLEVIAEGVENSETLELLRTWGCEWAQGYHISKPIPKQDVPGFLQQFGNAPDHAQNQTA